MKNVMAVLFLNYSSFSISLSHTFDRLPWPLRSHSGWARASLLHPRHGSGLVWSDHHKKCELSPLYHNSADFSQMRAGVCRQQIEGKRGFREPAWNTPLCSVRSGMWSRSQSNLQHPWETGSCLPGCHFPICVFHFSLSGPIWIAGAAATAGFRRWDSRTWTTYTHVGLDTSY